MRFIGIVLSLLPSVLSVSLSITIPSSDVIFNPSTLPPSTSASLTTLQETYSAPLSTSNSFHFRNVSTGSYLLSIQCPTHNFALLRVDVSADGMAQAWRTFIGHGWDNKGDARVIGEGNVIELRAFGAKDYYMERAGFSPMSILKNPMILIAGFGMLAVFGIPYLLDNMDPDLRAEFEANQKKNSVNNLLGRGEQQQGLNSMANFDAAAWLAGSPRKGEGNSEHNEERGVSR